MMCGFFLDLAAGLSTAAFDNGQQAPVSAKFVLAFQSSKYADTATILTRCDFVGSLPNLYTLILRHFLTISVEQV